MVDNENDLGEQKQRIGRFEVIGKLGEGAMSVVYKAFDPSINRVLGIKLLHRHCSSDAEYRHRFLSEAKAAGKLIHPNIVTIFDVGEIEKQPYIAMEYLEGKTLQDVMKGRGRLPVCDVVRIGLQLASALGYAARKGVVHRDIKPSNILVLDDGSVRITDFGIAHIDTGAEDYTRHGTVLGTPQYMSPEQAEGVGVDGRADLFSVGVVLYQMVTGDKPFKASTLASLMAKIARENPVSIAKLSPGTPPGLRKIIEKLLQKSPAERFQSGDELFEALQALQLELDGQEDPLAQQAVVRLKWKWTIVLTLIVAVVMLVAIYFVYERQMSVMTQMMIDSGSSIAELVADETADKVLLEEWVAVDGVVQSLRKHAEVAYAAIYDLDGVIRASTHDDIGRTRQAPLEFQRIMSKGGGIVSEWKRDNEEVFDFNVPIQFQGRIVGGVQLGVSKKSLKDAARLMLIMMLSLMGAVLLVVIAVTYLLVSRLSAPLRLLERGMQHVTHGNYSHRIHNKRNDELGRMFKCFNQMSESLEKKFAEPAERAEEDAERSDEDHDLTVIRKSRPRGRFPSPEKSSTT